MTSPIYVDRSDRSPWNSLAHGLVARLVRGGRRRGSSPADLERIMFSRNHFVVSRKHVNPLYINWVEQIHRVDGSPLAIPSDPDLL